MGTKNGIFVADPTTQTEWVVGIFRDGEEGVTPESVWEHAEQCHTAYVDGVEIFVKVRGK